MYAVPKFRIYDDQQDAEGVFVWGESRSKLFERYYDASDLYYMGEIKKSQKMVQEILDEDAHFIDAHNLLGDIALEAGNLQKARAHHKKAMEVGDKIIPSVFEGKIRWGFMENRPYLRAIHSYAQDLLDQRDIGAAIPLFERLLDYNPQDNQGIRLLIGDLYFVNGEPNKAGGFYKNNLDYPPYLYSYGLLNFSRKNYTKAAKFFRKGICSNIYISDLLCGKLPIIEYQIWHSTNYELPLTAYSYLDIMSQKWFELREAIELLNFLHIAEPSRSEIANIYMLRQDLYYSDSGLDDYGFEEDPDADIRQELLSDIEQIKKRIDDASSRQLVKRWQENPFKQRPDL